MRHFNLVFGWERICKAFGIRASARVAMFVLKSFCHTGTQRALEVKRMGLSQ